MWSRVTTSINISGAAFSLRILRSTVLKDAFRRLPEIPMIRIAFVTSLINSLLLAVIGEPDAILAPRITASIHHAAVFRFGFHGPACVALLLPLWYLVGSYRT